jgi:plastocyanin
VATNESERVERLWPTLDGLAWEVHHRMRPAQTARFLRLTPSRFAPAILAAGLVVSACTSVAPGWTFAPPPPVTPAPSAGASSDLPGTSPVASGTASGSPAASSGASAGASAGASDGGGGALLSVKAENIAFDVASLTAPANAAFQIKFENDDVSTQHDVAIKDSSGALKWQGDLITGKAETTYNVPALPAGSYTFICIVHPSMTGTLDIH